MAGQSEEEGKADGAVDEPGFDRRPEAESVAGDQTDAGENKKSQQNNGDQAESADEVPWQ